MKRRKNLLPYSSKRKKLISVVSLNKSDTEIREEIQKAIIPLPQEEEEEKEEEERKGEGWFDSNDSASENYLRFMASVHERGENNAVARNIRTFLAAHREALQCLRKAKSSVVCDISGMNIGRLESITKKYVEENEFLVEPDPSKHRLCARGTLCLCLAMAARYPDTVEDLSQDSNGFVGREFLLPTQLERFQRTGALPLFRRHCLVCNRASTCLAYTAMIHENEEPDHMILDHRYDRLDEPGEYRKNICLSIVIKNIKTTVCSPFVEFCANRYEYTRKKGQRRLSEINVIHQDFHNAPLPTGRTGGPSEISQP